MHTPLLLCCLSLCMVACVSKRPDSRASKLEYETIQTEAYGNWEDPGHLLVQDSESWAEAWGRLYEGQSPLPPQQYVDFSQKSLLIYRLGTRSTGGYQVSVQNMQVQDDTILVDVVEEQPGAGCMTTMAITNPFVVVAFDKQQAADLKVRVTVQKRPCN